jgi:hypothetical protein
MYKNGRWYNLATDMVPVVMYGSTGDICTDLAKKNKANDLSSHYNCMYRGIKSLSTTQSAIFNLALAELCIGGGISGSRGGGASRN